MTKAKKYLLLGAISISALACKKDIFDKQDLTGVNDDVWNTESSANVYINTVYYNVMPNWPTPGSLHNSTDELNNSNGTPNAVLYGQLTESNGVPDIASANSSDANNKYFSIRRVNIAIAGIEGSTLDAATKAKLKGQMYFFRAFLYFNLVKLYGGVPLITKAQDPGVDSIFTTRAKTSTCIKQIVSDLDSCYGLPATWPLSTDGGRITRAVAQALKGKVLMYWASPQFNPNDNHPERWTDAYNACKTAYNTALADGYDIYALDKVWIDETTSNKERMMWRTCDATSVSPARGTNNENITRPVSETTGGGGSNQPTWNLVQAFPMDNGLPITADARYDATTFWLNRDPRFYQTIAYNGSVWPLSGKAGRLQWNYIGVLEDASKQTSTGFYCKKICNPAISATQAAYNTNSAGGSGMDWIEMRFAEVLLNYAEAANGAGFLSEAKTALVYLRQKRGLVAGTQNYGTNNIADRAAMFTVLLNERNIEFAMENKRYDDLRRTRQFDKLTGIARQGLQIAIKSPYVAGAKPGTPVAGKIYLDAPDATGVRARDTININNKANYLKYFTPTLVTLTVDASLPNTMTYPAQFYFYPIPQNFLQSNPLLQQNIGWTNGTFDPLQ